MLNWGPVIDLYLENYLAIAQPQTNFLGPISQIWNRNRGKRSTRFSRQGSHIQTQEIRGTNFLSEVCNKRWSQNGRVIFNLGCHRMTKLAPTEFLLVPTILESYRLFQPELFWSFGHLFKWSLENILVESPRFSVFLLVSSSLVNSIVYLCASELVENNYFPLACCWETNGNARNIDNLFRNWSSQKVT